ncbi:hypothetical protein Tco_0453362 [Tanacetum coccineum]
MAVNCDGYVLSVESAPGYVLPLRAIEKRNNLRCRLRDTDVRCVIIVEDRSFLGTLSSQSARYDGSEWSTYLALRVVSLRPSIAVALFSLFDSMPLSGYGALSHL